MESGYKELKIKTIEKNGYTELKVRPIEKNGNSVEYRIRGNSKESLYSQLLELLDSKVF